VVKAGDVRREISVIYSLREMENFITVLKNIVHMLTARQQEVFDFLKQFQRETGVIPSTREIQEHFGFASQTAAMSHLRALEKKGAIERLPGKARAVVFPDEMDRPEVVDVPIYGTIAAGMATDGVEMREGAIAVDAQTLGVSRGAKTFALKVRGESMIDAHIMDGDHVILEHRTPRHGDIVAALIDGETTLKRYITDHRRPYLKAENVDYPDLIPARELVIQGVMVGLVRHRGRGRYV
jgi:repressor LexA